MRENSDMTKAAEAREIVAFADQWRQAAGTDPGLLVFDAKLTTYKVLSELTARDLLDDPARSRTEADGCPRRPRPSAIDLI